MKGEPGTVNMTELDSPAYQSNIHLLSQALEQLAKIHPHFLRNNAAVSNALATLRDLKKTLVSQRLEMELKKHRTLNENTVQYTWWFYPLCFPSKEVFPYQVTQNSDFHHHWIDAVEHAVQRAKQCKLLKHTRKGSFVLVLSDKDNFAKYRLYEARTALQEDGSLPDFHCPHPSRVSCDLLTLVQDMQNYLAGQDEWDGPAGYPFIIARPL